MFLFTLFILLLLTIVGHVEAQTVFNVPLGPAGKKHLLLFLVSSQLTEGRHFVASQPRLVTSGFTSRIENLLELRSY